MKTLNLTKRLILIKNTLSDKKSTWISFVLAGLITVTWSFSQSTQKEEPKSVEQTNYDTFIPYGYSLVPIEVQNYESLDSIFGNYGVVSLFIPPNETNKTPKLLAKKIKMLRAPLNPGQFGVLVKESEVSQIAGHIGPLFVILHNRDTKTQGLTIEKPSKVSRFQIVED